MPCVELILEVLGVRAHRVGAVIAALLILSAAVTWAQGWDAGDLWSAEDVRDAPVTSWFGGTGMIVIPTAEVLAPRQWQAHYNMIEAEGASDWHYLYGGNVSPMEGLEVGVTVLDDAYTPEGEDEETIFQAKYQMDLAEFLDMQEGLPTLAIGGRDFNNDVNRTYYAVLTASLQSETDTSKAARVSLGYGDTEVSNAPLDGFFGGVDFCPFEFARLQIENDGENTNAMLRYWWSEWAITEIGVIDGELALGATLDSAF